MQSLWTLKRAFVINQVMVRNGLDEFLAPTPLARLSVWLKVFAFQTASKQALTRGQRLNLALTELGPIYVKLGQMLSTRRDLLPEDLALELAKLQDKVTPFDPEQAKHLVEQQLGLPIGAVFSQFDREPMASASVAQVHGAVLLSGEQVVVKIIRPGIKKQILADLKLLSLLAKWAEKYSKTARRLHIIEVIKDYQTTILNELDLRIEAANASQLKRNFAPTDHAPKPALYVPGVYWDWCKEKVMVQERIFGIPIGNIEALRAADVDMKLLAHRGVEIFFTQVFKHSYFHADMHPGNIFVDVSDPKDPTYIGIDCGIMGTLGESDKQYLAKNFMAFFNRDYRQIAQLHIDSGWISKQVSVEAFESAIRTACEPIFGKPLDEISFGHFLVQLFQTARRFDMEVQPQLVLLQKTLLYIEGLGRQLYPKLDLWETAQPFLTSWAKENYGIQAIYQKMLNRAPDWLYRLPDLPDRLLRLMAHQEELAEQQVAMLEKIQLSESGKKHRGQKNSWGLFGVAWVITGIGMPADWLAFEWQRGVFLGLSLVCFVLSFRGR